MGLGQTISIHDNGFKFLKQDESKRVNLKSFLNRYHALASTQFRVKESFKLLFDIVL